MSNIPIRCFTCGKVIASIFESEYSPRVDAGEDPYAVLDDLKVGRECCRRMFTTHVDIDRFAGMYPTYPGRIQRVGPARKTKKVSEEESISEEDE